MIGSNGIYIYISILAFVYSIVQKKICKIEKDLKVYILQDNATGTREKREFMEDHWITRLNTKSPNGMNSNLKDFAKTFYSLF